MEMPQPGEAHAKLQRLVGNWTGEERIHPSPFDPEGGTAIGRVNNVSGLGGFVVIQDYQQERGGAASFSGHGVFGVDPTGAYTMTWWDSFGMPGQLFSGTFEGDQLVLTGDGPQGGKNRATFVVGENEYTFKMEVSMDGVEWFPFMEGSYTK